MLSHQISKTASTRAPAKLNLFLELRSRRNDGYHEIDTVMVPIDWSDELSIGRTATKGIRIRYDWLPSRAAMAQWLGFADDLPQAERLLAIPTDETNLITRALTRMIEVFGIDGGFECELHKRIPAGAGLGGASSDAASAIRCAAALCEIDLNTPELLQIAAQIGSDVPFFLGHGGQRLSAFRAQGRGERLMSVPLAAPLDVVVIYPSVSLSTALVYAGSQIPAEPRDAGDLIRAMSAGNPAEIGAAMMNRLSDPARILAPQIDEILESVWRTGCRTCQLTGSGSACFAIVGSPDEAHRLAIKLRDAFGQSTDFGRGAVVVATRTVQVPWPIKLQ